MIKILDSTKSLTTLASDTSNGLGQLNPVSCKVSEELNGLFECELEVLQSDKHFKDLSEGGILKMSVNDTDSEQMFRVYYISKAINGVCTVKGQHITYDLSKVPVQPFTATGAVNVKNSLVSNIIGSYPFTMSTDITNTISTFKLSIPRSFRECLGGYEGSVLDVFRCEYKWDNLEVKMLARRGADNGVRIAYGKNLTDFNQEENIENVYDGVLGYAVVDDVPYLASSVYNKTSASQPKIKIVDFSDKYESGDVPTGAELLSYATTYATNNDIEVPNVNISVKFIALSQTEEYKNILPLERVSLGDTVHVYFDKLGVEASSRVVKTVWNVLLNKYDEIELGQTKANLNTVLNDTADQLKDDLKNELEFDTGAIENKMIGLSSLIANGMGLRITQDQNNRIFLHNAETLALSQYQYEITSNGFMMSDDYGQTWSSGWSISGDAVMNSLATITLKALEIYGSYIEGSQILFGDSNNKYILAEVYLDNNNNPSGITFDGSGNVRFRPQGVFEVLNLDSNSNIMSRFAVGKTTGNNYVTFYNNDQNGNVMNQLGMSAGYNGDNSFSFYNHRLYNGATSYSNWFKFEDDGTNVKVDIKNFSYYGSYKNGNTLSMLANSSNNIIEYDNYNYNTANKANDIVMKSDSSGNSIVLTSRNSNGVSQSYVEIKNGDMILYSKSAIRMYSNAEQDIQISASDDVILGVSYGFIKFNSYYVYADGSNYLRIAGSKPSSRGY